MAGRKSTKRNPYDHAVENLYLFIANDGNLYRTYSSARDAVQRMIADGSYSKAKAAARLGSLVKHGARLLNAESDAEDRHRYSETELRQVADRLVDHYFSDSLLGMKSNPLTVNPTNRSGYSFKKGDAVQDNRGVYRGIYIKLQPATSFSRAYGPQALVWYGTGAIPKGAALGSLGVESIGLGDIKPAAKKNPLTVNPFKTMSEVRGAHKAAGLHFFDKGAGEMFGEVALKGPYRGHYVVSQQVMTFDDGIPRRKGVVSYFADDGSKRHVKTFEGPSSWTDAVDFAKGKGEVRSNPLTVNPRHVGATKPPGTVVIEDNVHKVPGYIVVTHAQVALAQRHAPGIAPLASLVTTDKGGPGRKAKRWHRWFLPESIKAQPWATASIKRRNPDPYHTSKMFGSSSVRSGLSPRYFEAWVKTQDGKVKYLAGSWNTSAQASNAAKKEYLSMSGHPNPRKNPMGDTWAIMSAADVMRANPRKTKAPAIPKWVHVKTFTRAGMAPRIYNATDVDDAVRIVKKELMAGDHLHQVSIRPLVGHGIGDGFDVNVSYSTSLMGPRHMKSFTFLPIQ